MLVAAATHKLGESEVHDLATWAVGVQRVHVATVRKALLKLAVQEAATAA